MGKTVDLERVFLQTLLHKDKGNVINNSDLLGLVRHRIYEDLNEYFNYQGNRMPKIDKLWELSKCNRR